MTTGKATRLDILNNCSTHHPRRSDGPTETGLIEIPTRDLISLLNVARAARKTAESLRWMGIQNNEAYEHNYEELVTVLDELENGE